ncbi:MAG: hypothetical protein M1838_003157, partial [Thelocarpon superellum]
RPRFTELTIFGGHVNNVTYIRYAESARVNWAQQVALHVDAAHKQEWRELVSSRGVGLILRSMQTDYKFPMTWPDRVTVYHKLRSSPSDEADSFTLDVMILSEVHQRPAARCVEDVVMYDYRQSRRTSLPPFMRHVFTQTFQQQEAEKQAYREQIHSLTQRVEGLERETWNHEDAKENLGRVEM